MTAPPSMPRGSGRSGLPVWPLCRCRRLPWPRSEPRPRRGV